jgi:hypothetical protein
VKGNLQISIGMPPTRQSYLHNSGLWTSCFKGMCALWDTRCRNGTFLSLPCICSIKAIGAPFPRSSGGSYINSGRGYTNELLTPPEVGDYHSRSSSPICFERKASRAFQQMGPSVSIHNSIGSSGIRAIPTCHRSIRPELQTG